VPYITREFILFLDKHCLTCMQIRFDLNEERYKGWEEKISLVEIEGSIAYYKGESQGKCPVSKTPALYSVINDEIIFGYSSIIGKIKDAII